MGRLGDFGRWLFLVAMGCAGGLALVNMRLVPVLQPWPGGQDTPVWAALATGVLLIAFAVACTIPSRARQGGFGLAALLAASAALLHAPGVARAPSDVTLWVGLLETLVLAGAALALVDDRAVRPARLLAGVTLVLFGAVHLYYRDAIGGMIPDWIPGGDLWPWLTGGGQVAAGLALLSGARARLASFLVGAMYLAWAALLHIPKTVAAPGDVMEWTGLILAVALSGAMWIIGARAADRR